MVDSSIEVEKTVKIITFSGKEEDWRMFKNKFMARGKRTNKLFKEVLQGKIKVPAASDVLDETTDKEKLQYRKANETVYDELILAMTDDVCFNIVCNATSQELPDGDAKHAWDELLAKFEVDSSATKVDLKKEFTNCVLKDITDPPDVWICKLEIIRERLKNMHSDMTDEDFMIHILNNCPKE